MCPKKIYTPTSDRYLPKNIYHVSDGYLFLKKNNIFSFQGFAGFVVLQAHQVCLLLVMSVPTLIVRNIARMPALEFIPVVTPAMEYEVCEFGNITYIAGLCTREHFCTSLGGTFVLH